MTLFDLFPILIFVPFSLWLLSPVQTGFEIGQILLDDHQKYLIQTKIYFHPSDDFFIFNFCQINLIVLKKVQNTEFSKKFTSSFLTEIRRTPRFSQIFKQVYFEVIFKGDLVTNS